MNQQEQEKIQELLLELSRLQPDLIDVDYDEGFAGGAVMISGNWHDFDEDIFPDQEAVIQAAIREALESGPYWYETRCCPLDYQDSPKYSYEFIIGGRPGQIICKWKYLGNLTLAMLHCYTTMLKEKQ